MHFIFTLSILIMVYNEEQLGSNLIKAMKSDQIAHRQTWRAWYFFRLNPVFLSALWKWCICRMTSLEVQQSRWDWTKGATMCSCLTAFQDWKLHFLFESRFFFRLLEKDETRLKRSRQARLNFDRAWFFCETKGFCSILITVIFFRWEH